MFKRRRMMLLLGQRPTRTVPAGHSLVWQDNFNTYNVVDPAESDLGETNWIPYFYGWNVRFLSGNADEGHKQADFEYGTATALDSDPTYSGMFKYNHYIHDITPSGTMLMRAFKSPAALIGDPTPEAPFFNFPYFCAMISTERSYNQGYGYFETRLRINNFFGGLHFSIWLLAKDLAWPPEIDILEVLGHEPEKWYSNIHGETPDAPLQHTIVPDYGSWHTLGFQRTATDLIWSLDGEVFRTSANYLTPPDRPMFFLMTYEVGGTWEGDPAVDAPWPGVLEVDYVRAYEPPEVPAGLVPLDGMTSGLAGAWDYRRLLTSWTGALIRVKRSSDSTEQDISYDAVTGQVNETTLTTFVGAGNGYVVKIYDQSGNGRDLTGVGTNGGFRIVAAGVVERKNGKICAKQVTDADAYYSTAAFTAYTGTNLALVAAIQVKTPAATNSNVLSLAPTSGAAYDSVGEAGLFMYDNSAFFVSSNFVQVVNEGMSSADIASISLRCNGTNMLLVRPPELSSSGAFTAAWNFTKVLVGNAGDGGIPSANTYIGTVAVWFADPGATAIETFRDNCTAYWT